jgi:hypothetical protein
MQEEAGPSPVRLMSLAEVLFLDWIAGNEGNVVVSTQAGSELDLCATHQQSADCA